MSEFEGKIEDADRGLKEMRPNKDGTVSWKYGLKVGGVWHSVFGSKAEVEAIKKDVDAGGNYAKGTYKLSKDGKYRNIEEVKISKTGQTPEAATDPTKGLAGAKQGKAEPRKEPLVQEERLGVEEVDALVDKHYVDAMHRARRIINQAGDKNVSTPAWISDDEKSRLLLAVFDKMASPLVYLRENIRRARAEAGVK